MVGTLLRLDQSHGWQPGFSAVVLLGRQPLSLTARSDVDAIATRIRRLRNVHHLFVAELTVDDDLVAEYSAADNPAAAAG